MKNENKSFKEIEILEATSTVKYLGVPQSFRKFSMLKFNNSHISKVKNLVDNATVSILEITKKREHNYFISVSIPQMIGGPRCNEVK
ncbi:MAG: hypothetical protein Ta2E_11120 [Mycoplasmoidaceae bacterium]|nr:MAG: hypothetical protein Ta2E_11120 [Mycoplasmoidaceae bacterium]